MSVAPLRQDNSQAAGTVTQENEDPFWPIARIAPLQQAEQRITESRGLNVDWCVFQLVWHLRAIYDQIQTLGVLFRSFYVGVTTCTFWRWADCHKHNPDFVSHRSMYDRMFVLCMDWGGAMCCVEELAIRWELIRTDCILEFKRGAIHEINDLIFRLHTYRQSTCFPSMSKKSRMSFATTIKFKLSMQWEVL